MVCVRKITFDFTSGVQVYVVSPNQVQSTTHAVSNSAMNTKKIEEVSFLLEEIVENYVVPEHKDAGEILDIRRSLLTFKGKFSVRGKLIDARNHWTVRHSSLDHVGKVSGDGTYRMKKRPVKS